MGLAATLIGGRQYARSARICPQACWRSAKTVAISKDARMALFKEGEAIWVQQPDGSARPGVFVGDGENATWFGGAPLAYVVYPDTKDGEEVNLARVTARDENEESA